jgi:hypothetical protein
MKLILKYGKPKGCTGLKNTSWWCQIGYSLEWQRAMVSLICCILKSDLASSNPNYVKGPSWDGFSSINLGDSIPIFGGVGFQENNRKNNAHISILAWMRARWPDRFYLRPCVQKLRESVRKSFKEAIDCVLVQLSS